jgi:hypothetical protein
MAELKLTLIAEGFKFPEGPVAMSDGSVVLTEMEGNRLLSVTPDGEIKVVAETDRGPNGLAVGPDNAFYQTNNGGSFQFFVRDGINMHGPTAPHHTSGAIQRVDLATVATTAVYIRCGERQLLALRLDASREVQFIEGIIGSSPVAAYRRDLLKVLVRRHCSAPSLLTPADRPRCRVEVVLGVDRLLVDASKVGRFVRRPRALVPRLMGIGADGTRAVGREVCCDAGREQVMWAAPPAVNGDELLWLAATICAGAAPFSTQSVIALNVFAAKSLVAGPPPQWAMLGTRNKRAKFEAWPNWTLFIALYQLTRSTPEKIPSLTLS